MPELPKFTTGRFFTILIIALSILLSNCKSTRLIPDDKYLLNEVSIELDNKNIEKSELNSYMRQKPNNSFLFFNSLKPRVSVYNFANSGKKRKWKQWIGKTIGEAPVTLDKTLTKKTSRQFKLFLRNKGYYHARVKDTTVLDEQKAHVIYHIKTGEPVKIRQFTIKSRDNNIKRILTSDNGNSLIKKGNNLDIDILQKERERITNFLHNRGYFKFVKEYIYYRVDTVQYIDTLVRNDTLAVSDSLRLYNQAKVELVIADEKRGVTKAKNDTVQGVQNHSRFKINKILIYSHYNPQKALQNQEEYLKTFDSLPVQNTKGCVFFTKEKLTIRPDILLKSILIHKDSLYRAKTVEETYKRLSSLRIYRLITINFEEEETDSAKSDDTHYKLLNCKIQLTPTTSQSYKVELEGTTSSTHFGMATNLAYQHKNLFRGAELFEFEFKNALESHRNLSTEESDKTYELNTVEIGADAKIHIPKFVMPFKLINFERQYNPRTTFALGFNYQHRPEITRLIGNARFGYYWKSSEFATHIVNPVDFYAMNNRKLDEAFLEEIISRNLLSSYYDHLISAISYSYIYNNQSITKKRDFVYLKTDVETSGNILTMINNAFDEPKDPEYDSYTLFKTPYFQYFKTDIDFRYYKVTSFKNQLVSRLYVGIGYPYGNVDYLPFGKMFYSGGSNSIRAWRVRSLGPGSYIDTTGIYVFRLGDIKLEANLEYRFKMFSYFEGALFIDAGNIWSVDKNDERQGASFAFDTFYHQIAVGTGLGVRLDFSFFIFRLDFGIALRDPTAAKGERWGFVKNKNYAFNFGIGYPF